MARIFFSAHDPAGHTVMDSVDAGNAEQAIASLAARGLANIRLRDVAELIAPRDERGGNPPPAPQALLPLRQQPEPSLRTFCAELLRRQRYWVALAAFLLASGLVLAQAIVVLLALGVLAFALLPALLQYRYAICHDRLLRAMAFGRWTDAAALAGQLASQVRKPMPAFDLAARAACICAAQGELEKARTALESWRERLHAKSPTLVDQRLAMVNYAAGDYAGFVAASRAAHLAAPADLALRVDLALAEARVGDVLAALELLAGVDPRKLPASRRPFHDWARGMIALRHGRSEAVTALAGATRSLQAHAANPATWLSLAQCSGAYALALAQQGRRDEAEAVLRPVWPVLRVHGDRLLLTLLRRELPAFAPQADKVRRDDRVARRGG